jgi:hypothetical protein
MTDDEGTFAQPPPMPIPPHRGIRGLERRGRVMKLTKQTAEGGKGRLVPRLRMDGLPGNIREHLATLLVESGADNPRGVLEALVLEVSEEAEDRLGPGSRRPHDRVTVPPHFVSAPARQWCFCHVQES